MTSVRSQPTDTLTAGIKVRPPNLLVAALLVGFALDHLLPLPVSIPRGGDLFHKLVPGALIVLGATVAAAGIRNFARTATPVQVNQPVRTLVTTGIHGWSRNPIYVGMLLLYLGIGVVVRNTWILLLTPLHYHCASLRRHRTGREVYGTAFRRLLSRLQSARQALAIMGGQRLGVQLVGVGPPWPGGRLPALRVAYCRPIR
jgi:protein-S-isoprenylcysteine O-methyltransferase Ste14